MSLEDALEQRLEVINCTPTDIQAFLRAHPPESRLTPVGGWGASALPRRCRRRRRLLQARQPSASFRVWCLLLADLWC